MLAGAGGTRRIRARRRGGAPARQRRGPRIELVRIAIRGDRAAARVRTRARGQAPLTDVIELRRENGRHRLESLRG